MKNKRKKINKKLKHIKRKKRVVKKSKKKVVKKRALKKIKVRPKTKSVKKLTVKERKVERLGNISNELIEKGRKRGFITYDEILKTFPDIENNILFLDELYEKLGIAGIDVLEGGNLLNLDIDLTDKDLNKGALHDSIQMYLKEIG